MSRLLSQPEQQQLADEHQLVWQAFLLSAPQLSSHSEQIRKLRSRPATQSTLVMAERPVQHPRPTYRHHRGEYLQPREQVQSGLPTALSGDHDNLPTTRLEFAEWIVSTENPLTARVVANRQWAAFFGTGIVRTVDDLGLQGAPPSHPKLLDWLAVTFRDDDAWSMRELHRKDRQQCYISSGRFGQQRRSERGSAESSVEFRAAISFGTRRLFATSCLWRVAYCPRRSAGRLCVLPQPAGVTEVAYGGGRWNAAKGADRYRRSLYTYAKRTAPFAMLATFDGPSGEACVARRNRSNSPLQALTLLNDVMLMGPGTAGCQTSDT